MYFVRDRHALPSTRRLTSRCLYILKTANPSDTHHKAPAYRMLALRPLFRSIPRRTHFFARTMASSSAPLQEWLVIVPDFKGALDKRLGARPKHLEGLKSDRDDMWLWGGAMLEEPIKEGDSGPPKMKGSAMLIGAKTREEVVERLKKDVYVQEGVWDVEKVEIIPFKSALRKAL